MKPPLSARFVDKAEAALVAAVEIYNKPTFAYREETFAMLMLNAWELLLKAKILAENNNKANAIRVYETRQTKSGAPSKKQYLKTNRCGNPITLGLPACMTRLDQNSATRLDKGAKLNLLALMEVRDNAAHYVHASPNLAKQVVEIGSASIQNWVLLGKKWFHRDLSKSLSLMVPLAFIGETRELPIVSLGADERNLVSYLEGLGKVTCSESEICHLALRMDIRLHRSNLINASTVQVSTDPSAVKVILTEEDIRNTFPWEYEEVVERLRKTFADFKCNRRFHNLMKAVKVNPKLVHNRLLDPGNPKSSKKVFYSSNVIQYFESHYTRKKKQPVPASV